MAEWIVDGEPALDVWHMDINRFGRAVPLARATRCARTVENYQTYYDIPYPGLQRAAGRPLRTLAGLRLARGARRGVRREGRLGAGRLLRAERRTRRPSRCAPRGLGRARLVAGDRRRAPAPPATAAGLFDESSFAKLEVSGPDAAEFLEWVCDNHVAARVGDVTYTQALNRRGGIEADFTVTRTGRRRRS